MNRRGFFKAVTGFVAGVFASTAKSKEDFPIEEQARKVSQDIYGDPDILHKRSSTRLVTKCEWEGAMKCRGSDTLCPRCRFNTGTSANINYRIEINCWDKDEPDIYTFKDGVPVS